MDRGGSVGTNKDLIGEKLNVEGQLQGTGELVMGMSGIGRDATVRGELEDHPLIWVEGRAE